MRDWQDSMNEVGLVKRACNSLLTCRGLQYSAIKLDDWIIPSFQFDFRYSSQSFVFDATSDVKSEYVPFVPTLRRWLIKQQI